MCIWGDVHNRPRPREVRLDGAQVAFWAEKFGASPDEIRAAIDGLLETKNLCIGWEGSDTPVSMADEPYLYEPDWPGEQENAENREGRE
jgi:hypothetical protein